MARFEENPGFELISEIYRYYLLNGEIDSARHFLKMCEKRLNQKALPNLYFLIAEDYFFAGEILNAREQYLKTVARFSNKEIANDALERLYLIEMARSDTLLLKRMAKSISFYEMKEFKVAEESLRVLKETRLGDYALYYLAMVYNQKDELKKALATLEELDRRFPAHKIKNSRILLAEVHLKLNNKKEAQGVLEEMIIKEPNSVYSIKAKRLLNKILKGS